MTARRLSRLAGDGRPAPPIRMLHLGLGNFFRAHQAWYTDRSSDAAEWGIAAFAGRSSGPTRELREQEGLYTLVVRGPEADRFELISSLCRAHPASDTEAWLAYFADPGLAVVTVTVTEAGYRRGGGRSAGGLDGGLNSGLDGELDGGLNSGLDGRLDRGLDVADPAVASDISRLRQGGDSDVRTAPARLVAGLAARWRASGAPIAIVPCDNVPGNARMARRVIADMAARVDAGLAAWIDESVDVVGTVVDRITPRTLAEDLKVVADRTGRTDATPVVTEPFSEWALSGRFPRGRPSWESAGAIFTGDLQPFEQRKLWLLNGAHSLLAYAGSVRGHETVYQAIEDDECRGWVEQWWAEASPHLAQPPAMVASYRSALLERFGNPRMHDRLARIAEDGSQKLPIRVVPVLRAERRAERLPIGAATIVAAWVCHLRGLGAPLRDARADEVLRVAAGDLPGAVRRVLGWLDPSLGNDRPLARLVEDRARMLAPQELG